MMIRAIAIDDEPIALEIVKNHAEKVPFLSLDETFTHAFKAMEYLQTNPVDLIFLDIKMPDISGIDFFKSLRRKPSVIFTTAYSEHAVTGFDLDAVDYLLKPFSLGRFLKACNKVQDSLAVRSSTDVLTNEGFIFLKTGYEQVRLDFEKIDYLEATGNYVNFVCGDQQILSRMTLSECEALLPHPQFVRIHRSFVVNIHKIQKVERHQVTANGYTLPVGNSYHANLKQML